MLWNVYTDVLTNVYGSIPSFFIGGKNFVWGAGVEDGLSQHFSALAYYGELLREFVKNLIAGHPKLMMWNMSLGYGADVIATLNYYAIGDPLNLLYGFVPVKYTEIMYNFMILLLNVSGGNRIYFVCKKDEEENVWNSDRGISVCLLRILFPAWT
ncbi:MAG: YfhO family protein [Anaerostipes hadrus]